MPKKLRYDMERLFQALGNETRLRLLNLMGDREVCVCELVEALGLLQPKISQHLSCLRSVGIVEARREGKWMHYRVVKPPHEGAEKVLRATMKWLKKDKVMAVDRGRLTEICCQTNTPEPE